MNKSPSTQYERMNLYYFTGTGNSRRVGIWFKEAAETQNIDVICKPIESANPKAEIDHSKRNLLVLGCPTHGFMAPYSMVRFAMKLPKAKGSKAAIFATRAGILIGKFQPPGLAGLNPFILSLILFLKGYGIKGIKTINMPSNWIQVHPGYNEKHSRQIIDRSKPSFDKFSEKILSGKRSLISLNNLYEFVFGVFFLPIALMYFFIGRFSLAKLNFASNKCDGCGLCARQCPVNAIKMFGKRRKRPYWTFSCEACNRCIGYCPKRAVEPSHHLLVFWVIFTMMFSLVQLLHLTSYFADLGQFSVNIKKFVEVILIFPFLFFVYLVFVLLMRIPLLATIFTWTNPAHYYRRYQEPDTKYNDFTKAD